MIGPWKLSDLKKVKPNGKRVFSCFHGGGGSSLGYRLAGYDVLGGVEIDPKMMAVYRKNLDPKLSHLQSVQEFKNTPLRRLQDLFDLDILDGSPPCSSFSSAGSREDGWGEKRVFREGQSEQVLDDLFFDFIDIAAKLQPKVVIAENVKGLILGNARGYVRDIFTAFSIAGYVPQLFLLNASRMGVPQRRERTFFIATRAGLKIPKISLDFNEPEISLEAALIGCKPDGRALPPSLASDWRKIRNGQTKRYFSSYVADPRRACQTLTSKATSSGGGVMHWDSPRKFSKSEVIRISTFPEDYDFLDLDPGYVCGMSVPPFMAMRVAQEVFRQLLSHRS